MASFKNGCDPCSRKKMSTVMSIQYCTDCEENLCKDCVEAHSSFKAFAYHHLIDSGLLPMETLSVKNTCTKHEEMVLDFFCVDHDFLCCRSCMAETHRICQQVVPVDVASKAVRRSPMLEDVLGTVSSTRETLEKLIFNRDENIKSLNDEESDVLRKVSRSKYTILEHLDDLETKVISQLKSTKMKCENQIKSDKNALSKMMESLDEVTSKLTIVSKHGSENQLFILLNSSKLKVSEYNIQMQKMIASMTTSTISFNQPQQPSIESLGSLHIESTPCPIKYKAPKSNQAQVLPTTIQMPTTFVFDFKFDIKSTDNVWITSIAVTDDNRLLLCNCDSTKLLVYSDRGEYLQDCTLSGKPWGMAIIPGEDKAVVTLPGLPSSIQFVDIKSMKSGETHSLPTMCHGIAVVGDNICVDGNGGRIYILSKQGKHTKTIYVPAIGYVTYLHPGPHDSFFYSAYVHGSIGCVKLSGEVCFKCTPKNFKGPEGVITDRGGNLYVACMDSNNIHRLSADGNVIDIILNQEEKINEPFGLTFSRNYRKLFVANDHGTSISAFSCS